MPTLLIQQTKGFKANVSFDGRDHQAQFKDPFTPEQEENLRWYFENHLEFPMLDTVRAAEAAASVETYGNHLYNQLFADKDLYAAVNNHQDDLRIEISGSPDFHRLHWETLWRPKAPKPLAYRTVIARKVKTEGRNRIDVPAKPAIRVLVVVARPHWEHDVSYRTISRPLVETLHQASLDVELDFLRPGTWQCLEERLANRRGHYHVLHFDGHGVVASVAQIEELKSKGKLLYEAAHKPDSETDQSRTAFLFFEGPTRPQKGEPIGQAIEAQEIADLVNDAQIPIVILNACQSARQESQSETSLASRLAQAGVRAVLAMAYSVTVSAAKRFMEEFYREAFAGKTISVAATRARQHLSLDKHRNAYFGLQVELEDWLLPVLYENQAVELKIRATQEEARAIRQRRADLFTARPLKHRFYGRDLDILAIERQILSASDTNELLIEGMGGTGKTTLLQHLAWWWHITSLVTRVFTFEYDQKPFTRQQILHEISRQLDVPIDPNERLHQEDIVRRLRSERSLLVLDNLESVTGEQLAIGQSLPEPDRRNLQEFLQKLRGGKTLVLIGSRSQEAWLAPGTFQDNIHALRGLDPEAASSFADELLRAANANASKIRATPEYRELLKLLAGHPLAMQVIWSNLGTKTPGEVLTALREGDVNLDHGETRTDSILKCIDYSHSNLSAYAKSLLECFAPFTGVVLEPSLEQYIQQLQAQPELAHLPWAQMPQVLAEAERWGLLRLEGPFLHLQPVFPYFLRSRIDVTRKAAVETAFRKHYDGLCEATVELQQSKEPQQRELGRQLAKAEYENAMRALHLSLAARDSILSPYVMLSNHLDETQDHAAGLSLATTVTAALEQYPPEALSGRLGLEMVGAIDDAASRFLLLKRYAEAKSAYRQALAIHMSNNSIPEEKRPRGSASIHHQLGNVAHAQREWAEAEQNYREALRICVEFKDRYSQARIYHQLGMVAEEQRQWAEAEKNYREALRIYVEFNDRYEQAGTYHQLGSVAQEQRQWAEAEQNYREALRIYVEFNDRYAQAAPYHQLGIVAQDQRQWAEAEKNYREALRILVEFNDHHSSASTYHQLGTVAEEQRQWAEAEQNYREALRIYVEFNDRYEQAGTYHQLGRVAQEQRQWAEAEQNYLVALQIYVEFKDRHNLGIVLRSLARIRPERPGLPARVAEILGTTAAQVEEIFKEINSPDAKSD